MNNRLLICCVVNLSEDQIEPRDVKGSEIEDEEQLVKEIEKEIEDELDDEKYQAVYRKADKKSDPRRS